MLRHVERSIDTLPGGGGAIAMSFGRFLLSYFAWKTFLTQGKTLTNLSCVPDADGVRTSGLWIWSPTDAVPTEPARHPEFPATAA